MQTELTQLTREKLSAASDPVQYARSQTPDIEDIYLGKAAAALPAAFADIFEYPDDNWSLRLEALTAAMRDKHLINEQLSEFSRKTEAMSLIDLQELYAQSFDLNPNCALEIGYHLFGEDYKRGAFLANLRETEGDLPLGQDQQLPDYLPVLLRLLAHLEDDELRGSLAGHCVIPGVKKIITAFKGANPYVDLLNAVLSALTQAVNKENDRVPIID